MAHVQQVLKEDIQPTCTIVNMETVMKMNVAVTLAHSLIILRVELIK
jgi:hypothetical protein